MKDFDINENEELTTQNGGFTVFVEDNGELTQHFIKVNLKESYIKTFNEEIPSLSAFNFWKLEQK